MVPVRASAMGYGAVEEPAKGMRTVVQNHTEQVVAVRSAGRRGDRPMKRERKNERVKNDRGAPYDADA